MLAMDVNDYACFLSNCVALGFIASTRASTGCSYKSRRSLNSLALR